MLGAGEMRFVLLDFLLTVLLWARRGSSATHGYGRGNITVHPRGRNGEFTHPLGQHHFPLPCTGWGQVLEGAAAALRKALPLIRGQLPTPLPLALLRFSGPVLAAHLPPAIGLEAAPTPQPPMAGGQRGTQRCRSWEHPEVLG